MACTGRAYSVHSMCVACALHVHSAACAWHVRSMCMCAACAWHVHGMCMACVHGREVGREVGRQRRAVEGRVAHEHLVDDDAEGPPVAVLVVADLEEDLRRHVVGRAHRRPDRRLPVAVPRGHALSSAHALPAALLLLGRHLLERRAAVGAVAARVDERARAAGRVELELGLRERLDQAEVRELDVAWLGLGLGLGVRVRVRGRG